MTEADITPEQWAERVAAAGLPQWNAIIAIGGHASKRTYHASAFVERRSISGVGDTPDAALAAILREREGLIHRCPTCGRAGETGCAPVAP